MKKIVEEFLIILLSVGKQKIKIVYNKLHSVLKIQLKMLVNHVKKIVIVVIQTLGNVGHKKTLDVMVQNLNQNQ